MSLYTFGAALWQHDWFSAVIQLALSLELTVIATNGWLNDHFIIITDVHHVKVTYGGDVHH